MAKTLRYPNGQILKGVHSRVAILRCEGRKATGALVTVAAPSATQTKAGGAVTKLAWSPTIGLTGTEGGCGRNYIKGKYIAKGTGNMTIKVAVKTVAGTKAVKTKGPSAGTVSTTTTTRAAILAPGTLVLKGTGVTKCKTLKYTALKVNDITTVMM